MKSMMRRSTRREIKNSLGRYLAILAIVALGVGFFSGLKVAKRAMQETAETYIDNENMYDYRLMTTLGFEAEDVEAISAAAGGAQVEPAIRQDFLTENSNGEERVMIAHSITEQINQLQIKEGRLPEQADECVVDERDYEIKVGDQLKIISANEEDIKDAFSYRTYTVTGKVTSPLYLNYERGSTSLGNGSINSFVFMQKEGFSAEAYSEVFLSYDTTGMSCFTEEYEDFLALYEKPLEDATDQTLERRFQAVLADAEEMISDGKEELQEQIADAEVEFADARKELEENQQKIIDSQKELEDAQEKINDARAQIQDGLRQIEDNRETASAYGDMALAALDAEKFNVQSNLIEVEKNQREVEKGYRELEKGKSKLADGWLEYENSYAEYEEEIANANQEIADAEADLQELRDNRENQHIYVLDRDSDVGFVSFKNDSTIVEGIADVFPLFFFLVAALICSTTMNRMIEEQRTQIGVLKALGYGNTAIMGKYIWYSGSAAVYGCAVGFFGGSFLFPAVIWEAYMLMYDFDSRLQYTLDLKWGLISLAGALLASVGVTIVSIISELNSVPAEMIRPKSPKDGKRIFLEYVPIIWNRLKFLYKVSIRNIVRYKKRFFMMVLGISGCTALLVTGFGIRDSIMNIVSMQYDEISLYDAEVTMEGTTSNKVRRQFQEDASSILDASTFIQSESFDLIVGKEKKTVALIAAENPEEMKQFISLHEGDGTEITYPSEGECVLTSKVAAKLGVEVGDTITAQNAEEEEISAKVVGISQNYVYNYMYITGDTYEEQLGTTPDYKVAYANYKRADTADTESAGAIEVRVNNVVSSLMKLDHVTAVSSNDLFKERFDGMIQSMNYIIIVIIICAGALAFIVLYNLTNINITERIREIATIKVLGFYAGEVSAYVLRENMVLTGIGALVGLLLGKGLHAFVIAQIDMDTIYFPTLVFPISYLYSFLLTYAFAIIVNLFMNGKLKKVNMAESLKSTE